MRLGLVEQVWFGSPWSRTEALRITKEVGFQAVDVQAETLEMEVSERAAFVADLDGSGLAVSSLGCFAFGLVDFRSYVRSFHIGALRAGVDFADELSAPNLLIAIGEYAWQELIPRENQWQRAASAVRAVAETAAAHGIEIVLEPEPFTSSLLDSVAMLARFLDSVDHPSVKANVDTSHLGLTDSSPRDLTSLEGRVGHVHFADGDGIKHGHLPPGRGVMPLREWLEAIMATGFDGTLSVELGPVPTPADARSWVEEGFESTVALLRDVGVEAASVLD